MKNAFRHAIALAVTSILSAGTVYAQCERNEPITRQKLEGTHTFDDNGETLWYESRVQAQSEEVYRYAYCIRNDRKYRGHVIRWSEDNTTPYFSGLVRASSERGGYNDLTNTAYSAKEISFQIDGNPVLTPMTVVPTKPVKDAVEEKTIELRIVLDIPSDPKIGQMIVNGDHHDWAPEELITVSLLFRSTFNPEKQEVYNGLEATVSGNSSIQYLLAEMPIVFRPLVDQPTQDFWGAEGAITLDNFVENEQLTVGTVRVPGGFREHRGYIEIGFSNEVYGVFPVNYFGP